MIGVEEMKQAMLYEKKPLNHFLPGTKTYSFATIGYLRTPKSKSRMREVHKESFGRLRHSFFSKKRR